MRLWPTKQARSAFLSARAAVGFHMVAVRRVLAEARKLGHLTHEAYLAAMEVPRIELPDRSPAGRDLGEDELVHIFDTAASKPSPMRERDACLVALLVGGGLRRAEAVGLDVTDYDQGVGKLTIRGKGGVKREVYARNEVRAYLDRWLRVRADHLAAADEVAALLLPVDRHGVIRPHRLSTTAIHKRVGLYVKATPHDCRRTFVGRSLDAGSDLAVVQQLVGHNGLV